MKSVSGAVPRLVVACRDDAGLRGYQQEMKERLYAMWQGTQHVMCQMPTGTGKTHLMVSVVRDMVRSGMGTVWIVAHRIELIEQISETLQRYGVDHGRVVSGYETTDERVQVASVQTLHRRLEGARTECRTPALIVIDEAHHAVAETYAALWRRFPQAFVLGLTATPCRLNGKGFTGLFERLLTSWTVDRFIDEGLLSGYDYVSILPESEAQRRVDSLTRRGRDGDFSLTEMDRVLKLGERMGCMFADEVIVISDVIRNLIAEKYGRTHHVHLIYNGVPQPDVCDFPEYFEELGIAPQQYLLGMCRFVPEKNLHHLVEAFAKLKGQGRLPKEMKLVLAGDTDFEDDYSRMLKQTAREQGVVLTGFVKGRQLHALLSQAKGYCLPSSHEGLPIALLEAMSYGLPVVVSDIPANLEV